MTIEQYASLAEIVGVIIIALTFVFLTIQLRQGTSALKSSAASSHLGHTMAVYGMLLEDMELFIQGMRDPSTLGAVERAKFNALLTINLQALQEGYLQLEAGAGNARVQEGWWQVMRNNFLSPGYRGHWERRKFMLDPKFREFVERDVLKRQPTPTDEAPATQ